MADKEKEVDTLEGGDAESDALRDESAQESMTERHARDVTIDELDKDPPENEEYEIEGGDTDWRKDKEESEEVEEEKEEKEEVEEKEEEKDEEKELDEKIKEDIIKYLDETGGTKYIVKGKEYDLRDLSAAEIKSRFSLAGRAHQLMQEAAEERKKITEERRVTEDAARRAQEIMRKYGDEATPDKIKLPDVLTPHEDDEPDVRAQKEINAELYREVQALKASNKEQGDILAGQNLEYALSTLEKEFPMMSREQVVAVMANYKDADIRVVAENSHNHMVSDEYIDSVFKARPEKLREIEEKAVEKYLAKKPGVKKVARKKSSTTVTKKTSEATKKIPRDFDAIDKAIDKMRGTEEWFED